MRVRSAFAERDFLGAGHHLAKSTKSTPPSTATDHITEITTSKSRFIRASSPNRNDPAGKQAKRPPTRVASKDHLGPFFGQFAAEQYFTSIARSFPVLPQVFTGHLTPLPELPPIFPWAFASPALNKNGNSPTAAMATILSIPISHLLGFLEPTIRPRRAECFNRGRIISWGVGKRNAEKHDGLLALQPLTSRP